MSEQVILGEGFRFLPYIVGQSPGEAATGVYKNPGIGIGSALWHDAIGVFFIMDGEGFFDNLVTSKDRKNKTFRDFADVFRNDPNYREMALAYARKKYDECKAGDLPNIDSRKVSAISAHFGRSLGVGSNKGEKGS